MKRMLAITMLTLTLTGLALSQTPTKAEQEVAKLMDELAAASQAGDVAALERIYAEEFVINGTSGYPTNRTDFIKSFKSGDRKITALKVDGRQIRVYGDAAVVYANITDDGQLGGRDSHFYYRMTIVVVKRQDRWQVVSFQSTNIASPRKQIEEEITKATDEIVAALGRTDVAAIDRLFADSYVVTQGNGSQTTKAALLEAYKSGSIKYSAASYRDLKIKTYGDTAVTTSILTLNGHNTGGDFVINAPITSTWVKQAGYWRLVAGHLSPNSAQK